MALNQRQERQDEDGSFIQPRTAWSWPATIPGPRWWWTVLGIAVLIVAGGFHNDLNAISQAANRVKTRVVVLADTGESAQRYMSNGVHGVVYRNVTSAALVDCVRKVARGETWVQDIAVPSELTENDMVGLRVRDRLTAKELRIVALIVQGYKNKEIATQLGTTEQVIKNYLRNVYDKIGVSDRLELALFTIHHRILNEAAAATAAAAQPPPQAGAGAPS